MKTLVLSIERAKERRDYIEAHLNHLQLDFSILRGIDGRELTKQDLTTKCDMEQLAKHPTWLTPGAIGCALSHLAAYRSFLASNENCVFIIEDDVVLPNNIKTILNDIANIIKENEVILLYFTSENKVEISTKNATKLNIGGVYFPMNNWQPTTAAAYVISRKAAIGLSENILPIKVTSDSWGYYHDRQIFDSFRVFAPAIIKTKNFKSSIDYFKIGSLKHKFADLIDKYKIPFLFHYLKKKRKNALDKRENNYIFTDKESPLCIESL